MPVASAQVKSALLLAGLYADSPVTVVEPMLSRDHTERMLAAMGARVERDGNAVTIHPADSLAPSGFAVPADLSSAAFFLVLGACVPGSEIRLPGVGVNPFRTGIVDVLRRMGAEITEESRREEGGEPVADLVVRGGELRATEVVPAEIPGLVDEVPAICVAAALAEGRTEIRGAEELRVKESDRIRSMTDALSALGVRCGEYPDGMWVEGPSEIAGGVRCDSRGDHRIAMSLAILSAASGVGIAVSDTACIDTSFPAFHDQLSRLTS
jgi:3-phosphoshikimate 1-carboxyvinyltransferase